MQRTVTATAGDQAPLATVPVTNTAWARASGSKPTRWPVRRCGRPSRRPPNNEVHVPQEETMVGKLWLTAITAATLLASPALAGWPSAQPAQVDPVDGQRVIREVVINGGLIGA